MTDIERKQIQRLVTSSEWEAVKKYLELFLERNFARQNQSVRRDTMLNTIWEAAAMEGGEAYVRAFYDGIINEAKK